MSWCHDGPCYASYRDCLPQRGKRVVSHETRVIVGHVEKKVKCSSRFPVITPKSKTSRFYAIHTRSLAKQILSRG